MRPLDVCVACCVSKEVEVDKQMCEWPLKRLTANHFYEYNCSAKSEVQDAREIGYFLPRMLELLAEGADIHHSIELSLDRLGRCPPGSWTREEQAALSSYAEHWLKCEHPCSTVQFVRTTYWDFWEHREYSNAFASDRPDFRRKVRMWLLDPAHRNRFAGKILSADFLALAEVQAPVGHTSFSTMVEGVFEQLTQ